MPYDCLGEVEPIPVAAPKEVQDSFSWDFGTAKEGEVLRHDFAFTNNAGRVLNVTGVDTSCGCTVSDVPKKVIDPGEKISVKVSFDTAGYSGAVKQYVYFRTDNPAEPITRYTITASVKKDK